MDEICTVTPAGCKRRMVRRGFGGVGVQYTSGKAAVTDDQLSVLDVRAGSDVGYLGVEVPGAFCYDDALALGRVLGVRKLIPPSIRGGG